MRIATLILGFLGLIPPAILAGIILTDRAEATAELPALKKQAAATGSKEGFQEYLQNHNQMIQATYFMLVAIPLGLFGAILAFTGRGLSGGGLMLVAALGPALLIPDPVHKLRVLGFSSLLVGGGILAFFVQPPLAWRRLDSREDEDESPRGRRPPTPRQPAHDNSEEPPRRRRRLRDDD
jgi:hypothetical protein